MHRKGRMRRLTSADRDDDRPALQHLDLHLDIVDLAYGLRPVA